MAAITEETAENDLLDYEEEEAETTTEVMTLSSSYEGVIQWRNFTFLRPHSPLNHSLLKSITIKINHY